MSITDKQLSSINKLNEYRGSPELNDGKRLIAKVSPKANITFQYRCRFNGKNKRFRIGKYPAISLKKARQIHKQMLELKEEEKNPEIAISGKTEFVTLNNCLGFWFKNKVSRRKERPRALYKSVVKNYFYDCISRYEYGKISARDWA